MPAVAIRPGWVLLGLMGVRSAAPSRKEFAEFVRDVEPRLLQALVGRYGPVDGRIATVDALSWAWEHWDRLASVGNKAGYLFRVGQTATRGMGTRPIPQDRSDAGSEGVPDVEPALGEALARLSTQQRTVVSLIHAFGWTQTEVAELLEVTPSTVREYLDRGLTRLRKDLEVRDAQ